MSGERFILVETLRFFGRRSWARRVCDAGTFDTEEEALAAYAREFGEPLDKRGQGMRVRRVVPAGNRRALRAELDGLRATDEEMAAKLAQAQADLAAAEQRAKDIEARCASWESAYTLARRREEIMCDALGVQNGECIDEVAKRVVRDRDEARRELAMEQDKLAIVRASHEGTSRKLAELQRAIEVLIAQARPAA